MKKFCGLKNDYVCVDNSSYGGSQTYFRNIDGLFCKGKDKGGCGIVAMGDTMAYLSKDTRFANIDSYCRYFNKIVRKSLWIPSRIGMSFLHIHFASKHMLKSFSLPYTCRWCFSKKKLYSRVKNMLVDNIPVILCIPKNFSRSKSKEMLNLYDSDSRPATRTHGHFVVITGICELNQKLFWEISSWGKKYYISIEEYINYSKHHIAGLLGNILLISKL